MRLSLAAGFNTNPSKSPSGNLFYTNLSIWAGRPHPLKPLYTDIRAHPYVESISPDGAGFLERWPASIRSALPRTLEMHPSSPDVIIYTGAATSARIAAAIVIGTELSSTTKEFPAVLPDVAGTECGTISCDAALIYGLERPALVATLFSLMDLLRGGCGDLSREFQL